MIKVNNLTKVYKTPEKSGNFLNDIFNRKTKTFTALQNISFEIGENELVGFIGPNGAGKTTTMKILSGILYPTAGSVKVLGKTPFKKDRSFLQQIAFVMGQKNQLLWELPALDSFKLNQTIYEIPEDKFKKNLYTLIEMLQCEKIINQPVKTLSLGQRMRMELIGSLLHDPKILFLDEPTIGLDIFAQTLIISFIKEYQWTHKATIILTSHYMKDVERLADRVLLIDKGTILFDNSLEKLISNHSQYKTVKIQLSKPLTKSFKLPESIQYTMEYPVLTLTVLKTELATNLNAILDKVAFIDISIEDETLEEVIKKTFSSSQSKA